MKRLLNKIQEVFSIHDVRQCSFEWWESLSCQEQLKIELDFFSKYEAGETTDIDIEVMYKTYTV